VTSATTQDHTTATTAEALNCGDGNSGSNITTAAADSNDSVYDRGKWGVDANHINTLKQGPLSTAVHR
jgi:hypothetical protein